MGVEPDQDFGAVEQQRFPEPVGRLWNEKEL